MSSIAQRSLRRSGRDYFHVLPLGERVAAEEDDGVVRVEPGLDFDIRAAAEAGLDAPALHSASVDDRAISAEESRSTAVAGRVSDSGVSASRIVTAAYMPGRSAPSGFGKSISTRSERFEAFSDQASRVTSAVNSRLPSDCTRTTAAVAAVEFARLHFRQVDKHSHSIKPGDGEQRRRARGRGLHEVPRVDVSRGHDSVVGRL